MEEAALLKRAQKMKDKNGKDKFFNNEMFTLFKCGESFTGNASNPMRRSNNNSSSSDRRQQQAAPPPPKQQQQQQRHGKFLTNNNTSKAGPQKQQQQQQRQKPPPAPASSVEAAAITSIESLPAVESDGSKKKNAKKDSSSQTPKFRREKHITVLEINKDETSGNKNSANKGLDTSKCERIRRYHRQTSLSDLRQQKAALGSKVARSSSLNSNGSNGSNNHNNSNTVSVRVGANNGGNAINKPLRRIPQDKDANNNNRVPKKSKVLQDPRKATNT